MAMLLWPAIFSLLLVSQPGCACAPGIDVLESAAAPMGTTARVGLFLGGAATAFVTHEAGHVLANVAYRNRPDFVGLTGLGFVPFFAISPDIGCDSAGCTTRTGAPFSGGRRGKYLISTAGFIVGDIASEIILSEAPCLRYQDAPFRTGWLTFNILLSVGYALASAAELEDGHGDAGGAATAAGWDRRLFAALLLTPALLDGYRYWWPGSVWAPWVSRGSKAAIVGVAFTF